MLRLRRVGSRHEVYHGDKFLGEVDDTHLRDYTSQLPHQDQIRQFSRSKAQELLSVNPSSRKREREELAMAVGVRKRELLHKFSDLRPDKAFKLASIQVLRENPGWATRYREDSRIARTV